MSADSRLAPGSRVGPYEMLALLGEGGMGAVYRAKDLRLSRDVALKVLHGGLAADEDRARRFEQEARAAGILNHPNIVAVYDIGQHEGSPYIVSELLQGETLRDRMAGGTLGWRKAVEYGIQVAHGLTAAHEKGIVHRDLKPENLFLTKDGLIKILDFGIAKLGRPGAEGVGSDIDTVSQTNPGTILGTAGYMSPEQVRGLVADHRSDIFSFGAVLIEMLTGKRAFKGTSPADTLSEILREDPTDGLEAGPGLSAGLLRVARRCLEKAPEDRFQTARDLAFALAGETAALASPNAAREHGSAQRSGGRVAVLAVAALGALGSVLGLWWGRTGAPAPTPLSFERLTSRLGGVQSARFAPDGETILYSARWGSDPIEVFSTRAATRGWRPLGLKDALVLAISSREELALLLRPQATAFGVFEGTLARAPMAGGTPREVLEGVLDADWSRDGKELAVIHLVGDRYRIEHPIGRVLYDPEPPVWLSGLRISPRTDQVALIEHTVAADTRGSVVVVGPDGQRRTLASGFTAIGDVNWSPSGDEIWFSATRKGGAPQQMHAVSGLGRERVLAETPGRFQMFDVSRRGQVLGARVNGWVEIRARGRGAPEEAELAATELSFISDLSDDGTLVLGTDVGQGGGGFAFYVQKTDGSRPVWLGEGDGQALSPDGRSVLAVRLDKKPQQLVVVPTGAGETRTLEPGPVVRYSRAVWDNTGRRIVFSGIDAHDSERVFLQDAEGGPPRAVTTDDVGLAKVGRPVSPDGRRVVALGPDGVPAVYPLAGGEPAGIPGLGDQDVPICWTPEGREILVARYDFTPPRVERIDVMSGRARPWNRLSRSVPSGLNGQYRILVTPDGESYVYGYSRRISDLYLTSPLR